MKPRPNARSTKIAGTLVTLGLGTIFLERFGLSEWQGSSGSGHIDPTLLSILVIVPLMLIGVGCVIFVAGRIFRF
ncbi:hypothetical protein [Devosia sp.]|uniref:hypothetical protein n=1 Tax=Devosia sp. TaxID=1871048 RepID=UPI003A8D9BE1